MMRVPRILSPIAVLTLLAAPTIAQTTNAAQLTAVQGVMASAGHGGFTAAAYEPDGTLILLEDAGDGVRLLKADAKASTVLAQAQIGAAGDHGLALALDAAGNVFVTGTSSSGSLSGTAGAAYPAAADMSVNGFVAKFSNSLQESFVTFLGAGRTAPAAIAVSGDSVFVTGSTYSTAFPVTASAIGQKPATGSTGNGFAVRLNQAGSAIIYSTYLTGYGGSTAPAGIAVDANDDAFVVGLTSASGYPTTAALEPQIIGSSSGFLTRLTPAGDGYTFSTFVAGAGLASVALDTAGNLLITGNVSPGGFPIATANAPLVATSYQTMLRLSPDGQSVLASALLAPATMSHATAAADGTVWVSGSGGRVPLLAGSTPPLSAEGDAFVEHFTSANLLDQTARLGGLPITHAAYESLSTMPAAPAIAANSATVAIASTLTNSTSSAYAASERFDLPLVNTPNTLLPSTVHDTLTLCASGQCTGSGGLATLLQTNNNAALGLSTDDAPNLTLHNLGSADAQGLAITAAGFTQTNNCGATLPAASQCAIVLSGSGPGTIAISSANGGMATATLGSLTQAAKPIARSANELDFGVVTSAAAVSRTITLTNLTASSQTFSSAQDGAALSTYTLTQSSTDCTAAGGNQLTVAANSACHVTLTLTASSNSSSDGAVHANWLFGTDDVLITGFTQAASLTASSSEIDFGLQFAGTPARDLPRYLYLSNNSPSAIAHSLVTLPTTSPFAVTDGCPESLPAHSVCALKLTYASATAPSRDTVTLQLDNGISVLVTGQTLPQALATGAATNPNISVSPGAVTFATAQPVTSVSSAAQTVTIANTGASSTPLAVASTGDFPITNNCSATLGAGANCTVLVGFAPSQPGTRQGLLSVTSSSSFAPTFVSLSGTGSAILPANNGVLALGETYVGEPLVAWQKVQQSFPTISATVSGTGFGVAFVEDTGVGHGTLPLSSFAPTAASTCANCWIGIAYAATSSGPATGSLSITSASGGNPYLLQVTASALPVTGVLLTPLTTDFGTVPVRSTSAVATVTFTNLLPSAAAVTVQSVTAGGDFSVVASNTGGPSCSGAVASTASCFVNVTFAPSATGQRVGTLTFTTDKGVFVANLTGFGAADPGIAFQPSTLVFNNTPDSSATAQTLTITNTGASAVMLGTLTSSNSSFAVTQPTTMTLSAGASTTVQVRFAPSNAFQSATLSVPVTQTISGQSVTNTYAVALDGQYAANAAGLVVLPGQANFGAAATSTLGLTRQFTLANFSAKTLAVSLALPRQFPLVSAASACATLAPGTSCSVSVGFVPAVSGQGIGTVTATGTPSDGSATLQALAYMNAYGTGAGSLSITAPNLIPYSPLSLGQVNSGQAQSTTTTITNNGSTPVTVRRIGVTAPFFATSTCGVTLQPKDQCAVAITYAPIDVMTSTTNAGPRNDSSMLNVESDASASPLVLGLVGSVVPVTGSTAANGSTLNSFALSTSALTFANTAVGNVAPAQAATLVNTGNVTLHITGVLGTADYPVTTTCGTLAAGASCTISASFAPSTQSSAATRPGAIEIQSDAAEPLEFLSLIGTSSPSPLTLSASSLNFGTVTVGTSSTLGLTVTNTTSAPVTFVSLGTTGDFGAAVGSCPSPGSTLAAGASCTLSLTFTPSTSGTRNGVFSLNTSATQVPLTVSLTGVGASAHLTVSPSALAFGPIAVGSPSSLTLTLTNSGTATVTNIAAAISGPNAANFAVTVPCPVAQLAPNQGCAMTVTFTPSATAAAMASLSISSSDPTSPITVPLTGSGSQPGGFMLTVDGGSTSTHTVKSGSPASFALMLTPSGGFTGTVALTCNGVQPAKYAMCSISPAMLTVTTTATQASTATISTVTSMAVTGGLTLGTLLILPLRRRSRRRWARRLSMGLLVVGSLGVAVSLGACGGGTSSNGGGSSNLRYSPAGTYQYTVTASSTSGPSVSSTVTLNLVVQ